MPEASFAGFPTAWREIGDTGQLMLMLHCSLGHAGAWKGVTARLPVGGFRVLAMDLPGHGHSGPIAVDADYDRQAAAMAAGLIGAHGARAAVVGHSFGAMVALRLALTRPELVTALVLIEPVFFSALADVNHPDIAAHGRADRAMFAALDAGDMDRAAELFLTEWGAPGEWARLDPAGRARMAGQMTVIRAGRAATGPESQDRLRLGDLAALDVPVLLIEGAASPPIIGDVMDLLDGAIPGAERQTIEGAGHMAPLSHPAGVALAVARFLSP